MNRIILIKIERDHCIFYRIVGFKIFDLLINQVIFKIQQVIGVLQPGAAPSVLSYARSF